jgi:two-component sensor histidine kinase/HAMP domain-containing protein
VAALTPPLHAALISFAGLPAGTALDIFDREGLRLFRFPPDPLAPVGASLDKDLVELTRSLRGQSFGSYAADSGELRVAAVDVVDVDGDGIPELFAASSTPRSTAIAPAVRGGAASLALIIVAAAASVLVGYLATRSSISRRVALLVSAAERYGRGEFEVRSGLAAARDEIGLLASTMDSMADSLVARERESSAAASRLEATVKEREVLLKEVHHRVCNSFQLVMSMLRLQAAETPEAPAAETLASTEGRVMAMALVHEKIYQSELFTSIDFADYLEAAARSLRQERVRGAGIVSVDSVPAPLDLVKAVPLALLVNEVASRAPGPLAARLTRTGAGRRRLALVGLEAGPGWEASLGALGRELVASLAEQAGGDFILGRSEEGPAAIVDFAISEPAGAA